MPTAELTVLCGVAYKELIPWGGCVVDPLGSGSLGMNARTVFTSLSPTESRFPLLPLVQLMHEHVQHKGMYEHACLRSTNVCMCISHLKTPIGHASPRGYLESSRGSELLKVAMHNYCIINSMCLIDIHEKQAEVVSFMPVRIIALSNNNQLCCRNG